MRTACEQLRRWQNAYPATPELAISINVSAGELVKRERSSSASRKLPRRGPGRSVLPDPRGHRKRRPPRTCTARSPRSTPSNARGSTSRSTTSAPATPRSRTCVACRSTSSRSRARSSRRKYRGSELERGSWRATVVRHVSKALRLALVAEGVETLLQVKRLNALGCGMAQGFHLARPCDVEAMETLLSSGGGLDPRSSCGRHRLPRSVPRKKAVRPRRVPPTRAAARNPA